jgi:glutamine synthetase
VVWFGLAWLQTVLLRASAALRKEALRLFDAMGDQSHTSIHTDSGLEQEFFLIDRSYYLKRPDLMVAGRTLIGAAPPKGQELEDQYFGHKSERFLDCMHAFEVEMWKLGVPIMTRHREVAPGQYEVAPRFAVSNVATDRNLIMMEVLRKVRGWRDPLCRGGWVLTRRRCCG